jgi:prevent-host-death family protein
MTTIPLAEARQNFSALVEQAVTTHQRILVTRNGAPAVWVIADDDLESIMETIDVLADAAAMRDVAESTADADSGRHFTVEETGMILAARADGIDLGDDVDVIAEMHARDLPDSVCMAALIAMIDARRHRSRGD